MSLLSQTVSMTFIAIGANLGDSRGNVVRAMEALERLAASSLLRSSLWQSTPVDCPPGSALFINAVAGFTVRAEETPESLLPKLGAIEWEFGRRRTGVPNEPRPLDLDLITFGAETRDTPSLVLPHPRAHLRRFVLEPLNEIAPDLVLPGQTRTIRQLLAALHSDEVLTRLS
jgi:2-amino-4-hydroxy-6-hydroxymethyldihydropteridine diphosphokinase